MLKKLNEIWLINIEYVVQLHVQKLSSFNAANYVDFCSEKSVAQFSVKINLLL